MGYPPEIANVWSSLDWSRRHTFLSQIFRNSYYFILIRNLKSRHKNSIYRQCNKATKTEIDIRTTYKVNYQDGNIIKFLKRVYTVCFGSDDRGLSFRPYKQVVLVKFLNNFSNNKPHDPHGFEEEIKIKSDIVKAVVEKFQNRTGEMMKLLKAYPMPVTWANYCMIPVTEPLV